MTLCGRIKAVLACSTPWTHVFTEWKAIESNVTEFSTGEKVKLQVAARYCKNCRKFEWKTKETFPKISKATEEDW